MAPLAAAIERKKSDTLTGTEMDGTCLDSDAASVSLHSVLLQVSEMCYMHISPPVTTTTIRQQSETQKGHLNDV